jgi:hypothetical protein
MPLTAIFLLSIYMVVHLLNDVVDSRAKNLKIFHMYKREDDYERATGFAANPTGD